LRIHPFIPLKKKEKVRRDYFRKKGGRDLPTEKGTTATIPGGKAIA
jgi:hypothetical protein